MDIGRFEITVPCYESVAEAAAALSRDVPPTIFAVHGQVFICQPSKRTVPIYFMGPLPEGGEIRAPYI